MTLCTSHGEHNCRLSGLGWEPWLLESIVQLEADVCARCPRRNKGKRRIAIDLLAGKDDRLIKAVMSSMKLYILDYDAEKAMPAGN